jgi:hypothetical protein
MTRKIIIIVKRTISCLIVTSILFMEVFGQGRSGQRPRSQRPQPLEAVHSDPSRRVQILHQSPPRMGINHSQGRTYVHQWGDECPPKVFKTFATVGIFYVYFIYLSLICPSKLMKVVPSNIYFFSSFYPSRTSGIFFHHCYKVSGI